MIHGIEIIVELIVHLLWSIVELLKKLMEELSVPPRCFIALGLPIDGEQTAVQDGEYCDQDETQHLQI
jgi:hypothetical protein